MRKFVSTVILAVFLFSTAMMIKQFFSQQAGTAAQSSAQQLSQATTVPVSVSTEPAETEPAATEPTLPISTEPLPPPEKIWVPAEVTGDPHMEELKNLNLDALRKVNPEVVGWIRIPDTDIDFPLTQGSDNQFYLKHTWDLERNSHGNIFLECKNTPDMTDFNTIIYGHHMQNGSMFAALAKYKEQDFFESHPYVYIVTDAGVLRYEVFSSYFTELDTKTYCLSFQQEQTRLDFLQLALDSSQIETGITPATTDRIITLSTCTGWGYLYRRVVQARLPMIEVYDT